tara:strand:- start:256 stop:1473 length:1218 start_codon:yes stop_codon:yes gene_type:complete
MIERIEENVRAEIARFDRGEHPVDFPLLPEIPAGRYVDPDFFALEQQNIWSKSWLFAGHVDELPGKGDFKLWRDAGSPIVIIRDQSGEIKGFFNTCRHRGGPLVREDQGTTKSLLCKYHCWNFDLDGRLLYVPDEHEFPGLDKSAHGLIPVKIALWGNWIFANLDPDAGPLEEFLGPLRQEMDDLGPDRLRLVEKHSLDIACNWKVAVDAFQEVYHLKHIHPATVHAALDHRGASMTLYSGGHSRMIVPHRDGSAARLSEKSDGTVRTSAPEHRITSSTSRAYNIFPNVVTPTAEFEWPSLIFWPTSIRTCRMDVWWWGQSDDCDPTTELWQTRLANFDTILGEDMENLGWVQESMETPGFTGVPLSYQERRIYNFHEAVDEMIGADLIPRNHAVPKLMKPFIET